MELTATKTGEGKKARGKRDCRVGTVESTACHKTIKVRYDYMVQHPKYGKYYTRSTTLHAHDEKNEATVGDVVELVACRRLSKLKCWRLLRIVRRLA